MNNTKKGVIRTAVIAAVFTMTISGVAFASGVNARDGIAIKAGLDFPGKLDIQKNNDDVTMKMHAGFSGAVEYAFGVNKYFSLGCGLSAQYPHPVNDDINGKLGFVDNYGIANFIIPAVSENIDVYSSLQLGLSYPYADITFRNNFDDSSFSFDIYWGAAAGVVLYRHYLVELYYKAHHGELEKGDDISEFEHRHFGMAVGYQF